MFTSLFLDFMRRINNLKTSNKNELEMLHSSEMVMQFSMQWEEHEMP